MKIPDYIAIGVLILVLVWVVADQFPRCKLLAPLLCVAPVITTLSQLS